MYATRCDNPSVTACIKGMTDEAKNWNFKVTVFDPAFDPQKQLSQIEDCVSSKVDAIAVTAVDQAAIVLDLKKAYDAGIPVITVGADTNAEGRKYTVSFIAPSFQEEGRNEGGMIADAVKPDLPGGLHSGQARPDQQR